MSAADGPARPAAARLPGGSLGALRDAELSGPSLLAAAGGWRGIVESSLPGLLFLVVYTLAGDLWVAVGASAAVSAVSLLIRIGRRETLMPALGGLAALGLSAFLAARSGNDADVFLPGLWTNAGYGLAVLLSALVGWPVVGILAGLVSGAGSRWRRMPHLRRVFTLLTLGWAAFFAVRIAVQLPLYLSGQIEALAATKLLMGPPMYAVWLVLTIVLARAAMLRAGLIGGAAAERDALATDAEAEATEAEAGLDGSGPDRLPR